MRQVVPTEGKYNRWVVIGEADSNNGPKRYYCRCDCGVRRVVSGFNLRNGISKSCGCLQKEQVAARNRIFSWTKGKPGHFAGVPRPDHSRKMKGRLNPNWRGGVSDENAKARRELNNWRKQVYERDNYQCRKCSAIGNQLQAHHIENFAQNKDLRDVVSNGVTLCKGCHRAFHREFGIKNNSQTQLVHFLWKE